MAVPRGGITVAGVGFDLSATVVFTSCSSFFTPGLIGRSAKHNVYMTVYIVFEMLRLRVSQHSNVPLNTEHVISEPSFHALDCTGDDNQTQPTENTQKNTEYTKLRKKLMPNTTRLALVTKKMQKKHKFKPKSEHVYALTVVHNIAQHSFHPPGNHCSSAVVFRRSGMVWLL